MEHFSKRRHAECSTGPGLKYGTVAVDDGHINTLVANTTLLSLSELIKKPDGDLTWT